MARWEDGAVIRCDPKGIVRAIAFDRLDIAGAFAIGTAFSSTVVGDDHPQAVAFFAAAVADGAVFGCPMSVEFGGYRRRFHFDAIVHKEGLVVMVRPDLNYDGLNWELEKLTGLNSGLINRQRDLVRVLMDAARLAAGESEPAPVQSSLPIFTDAEREVIPMLLDGAPNNVIAISLGVEVSAVKARMRTIFRRLGVSSRGQAIKLLLNAQKEGVGIGR